MIILLILSFTLNNNINVLGDTIFSDYKRKVYGLTYHTFKFTV